MPTNKEQITYIEDTVEEKGYNLNTFKIENIGGQVDVVWNISNQPHKVCEYFREQDINIIPVRGMYGVTSLIFDADPFPNDFYKHVDNLPQIKENKCIIRKFNCNDALKELYKTYPSMVELVWNHYTDYSNLQIIEFLMDKLNFKEFVTKVDDDTFLIEMLIEAE